MQNIDYIQQEVEDAAGMSRAKVRPRILLAYWIQPASKTEIAADR